MDHPNAQLSFAPLRTRRRPRTCNKITKTSNATTTIMSFLSILLLFNGRSITPIEAEAPLVSIIHNNENKVKQHSESSFPLGSLSENRLGEATGTMSFDREDFVTERNLQAEQSPIVEVLDLGIDLPVMDENSDVTDATFKEMGIVSSNGVTFTIENLSKNQALQFLGLEVLIKKADMPVTVQIYAREGADMVNPLEQSSDEWILLEEKSDLVLIKDRTVQFVSVPLTGEPYTIKANSASTIFILVDQAQSIMISTKKSKEIVKEHVDGWVKLLSGTSVSEAKDRPDNEWSSKPSSAFLGSIFCTLGEKPESSPTSGLTSTYTLDTWAVWEAGDIPTRTYGVVFDVFSSTGCNITSLDIHTPLTTYTVVEVYTMVVSGTGEEDDGSWTLRSKAGVMGMGQTALTSIPSEQFKTLTLPPETKASFFVTTTQIEIASISTTNFVGSPVEGAEIFDKLNQVKVQPTQPTSLDVLVGQTIVRYPIMEADSNGKYVFPLASEDVGSKAIFSGALHYEASLPIETTEAPTPAPTLAPTETLNPELISQLKLSIAGVSRRTLIRQLQSSGGTMSNDDIRRYFEDIGRVFVNGMVNSKGDGSVPIDVRRFVVSPEITDADLDEGQQRKLWERFLQGGDGDDKEEGEDDVPKLDVYTTILGEYSPPPVVDFSALTEDAFDQDGDEFIRELKNDPPPEVGKTFEEAQSVRAEQVTFPKPKNLCEDLEEQEQKQEETQINFLIYVYIGSACAVGLLCCIITVCMLRRNRNEKSRKKEMKKRMNQEARAAQYANAGASHVSYDKQRQYQQQQQMRYDDRFQNQAGYNNSNMERPLYSKGYSKTSLVSSGNRSYPRPDDRRQNPYPPPPQSRPPHSENMRSAYRDGYNGTLSTSRRSSNASSSGDSRRPLRRASQGSHSSGGRRRSKDSAGDGGYITGHERYMQVPVEEPVPSHPRYFEHDDDVMAPRGTTPTSYYGDMEDPNHSQLRSADESRRQSDGSHSLHLNGNRDDRNIADANDGDEQRFWSLSGRHILSGSGRRIWDAETGEPEFVDDHHDHQRGHSPQPHSPHHEEPQYDYRAR